MIPEKFLLPLTAGKSLSTASAENLFRLVFSGNLSDREVRTLLLLLAQKGESADEITGALKALRFYEKETTSGLSIVIDTCGTGGDGSGSMNISTLSAFVAAGAGVHVAKHGNRSVSSKCGSSDLMEALGVPLEVSMPMAIRSLREAGMAYFHAPQFHPVFSKFQTVRKSLGIRTMFNLIGPLANPVHLTARLVGVANPELAQTYAKTLANLGTSRALVCSSRDGLDEISISSITDAYWISNKSVNKIQIDPRKFGIPFVSRSKIQGGSIEKNKLIALDLLQGESSGPIRDIVLINAGAALWISGATQDLGSGIESARQSLHTGKAYQVLLDMIRITQNLSVGAAA